MIRPHELLNTIPGMHTLEEVTAMQAYAAKAPGPCVNVGAYLGLSTVALASTSKEDVWAVDRFKDEVITSPTNADGFAYKAANIDKFRANVARMGVADKVHLLQNDAADEARRWRKPIGLLFMDADPNDAPENVTAWGKFVADGGYLLLHDPHEPPVQRAMHMLGASGDWERIDWIDLLVVYKRVGGGFAEGVKAAAQEAVAEALAKQDVPKRSKNTVGEARRGKRL